MRHPPIPIISVHAHLDSESAICIFPANPQNSILKLLCRVFLRLLFFETEDFHKLRNNCYSLKEQTLSFSEHQKVLKTVQYS